MIGGHAELTHVIRQRDPDDRAVCQAIREGNAAWALDNLHRRGRLHLAPDRSTAIKEIVHAWDQHRRHHGLDQVKIVTDTDNHTIDTLNSLCQARRLAAGELHGPPIEIHDQITGRQECLYAGDRISFTRPYRHHGTYIANGTRGQVVQVDPGRSTVTIGCDNGPILTVRSANLEGTQPLRLAYATHALRLQGGQANIVLVLPGSWQTSRQSAYSMLTRCVHEVHTFLGSEAEGTGAYDHSSSVQLLADDWIADAGKPAALSHLDPSEACLQFPSEATSLSDPRACALDLSPGDL